VVIHALEGWLLGDPDAIQSYLGSGMKANIKPSDSLRCKPKETPSNIFKRVGKDFDYIRDNPRIAELCDLDRISKRNKSFAHFMRVIEDP
jgi:hypothetical protein